MHESVLLAEAIASLNVRPQGVYIDCTFGRGGHTREILRKLGDAGRILALDRDPGAIESGQALAADPRLELVHAPFSRLEQILDSRQLLGQVDGVLMDLGVSSPQLDNPERGFSFRHSGPLDMRMDPTSGPSAADWLTDVSEKDLRECLWALGEERYARRIAKRIVEVRLREAIETTAQLAAIVRDAVPPSRGRIDPATRTFQAIRLRINSELEELTTGLQAAVASVRVGGRVAVLAFHSLEDRIVKRYFRQISRRPDSTTAPGPEFGLLTRKPIRPTDDETRRNARARSARLRVLERVA